MGPGGGSGRWWGSISGGGAVGTAEGAREYDDGAVNIRFGFEREQFKCLGCCGMQRIGASVAASIEVSRHPLIM